MKKSIFALAALGAFASAAQAQSSVTLFGAFDSSVAYVTGLANGGSGNTIPTSAGSSSTYTTGSGTFFIDSAIVTSMWGMRGSEDLGGGMKANFHLESDALTNNGSGHTGYLFRRAANVSVADSKLGELFLGRRGNAYIMATGGMLPVQGNTAHQWRTVIGSSVGDQVANSVFYQSPKIMGTAVAVQMGMNNTVDGGDDGTITAANLFNTSIPNLTISAGYNNQKGARSAGYTTSTTTNASLVANNAVGAANNTTTNREGYAVGLKYKMTPAIEVGTFYAHGRVNNGGAAGTATTGFSAGAAGLGLGYQATPAILLGANYVKATSEATMTNLQAHYMLSKRTRIYSQMTFAQKPNMNAQNGGASMPVFGATGCNSHQNNGSNVSQTAQCAAALAPTVGSSTVPLSQNAYSVGVIHTF